MEAIKINVEVSLNLSESAQQFVMGLVGLASGLRSCQCVTTGESAEAKDPEKPKSARTKSSKPKSARTKSSKPKEAPAPVEEAPAPAPAPAEEAPAPVEEAPAPVEEAPAPVEEAPAPAPSVTIDDVRRELAKKVGTHRESIKNKLNSFDAPSVTKLDPSKYYEMYEFLVSLPNEN